jgi:hypothetical protein
MIFFLREKMNVTLYDYYLYNFKIIIAWNKGLKKWNWCEFKDKIW